MSHLLLDSPYYANWKKHTHLKESAKYTYSRQFLKFEHYLSQDYDGELDFDKFFFTLLHGLGMVKQNPMKNFPNPYYERRIIDRSLSLEECQKLFQVAIKADPFVRKYFTLFLLMTTTALRNREIIQLTLEQIDFERRVIIVNKGQKTISEVVYMPDSLVEELERYLNHPSITRMAEIRPSRGFLRE
ncbi:site-specific integrase [Paenibacillus sediminis]|uniref:Site-specific recombinase XerD n=1 Tax=Paenibacillus sediminis TaxID=664909 RepID=A0ABS4GZ50_9BACL|nr:site-specific integrase [Paenibacillus sediminis]MBP1935332.1 site-specific recombinase XerD [Paenibacillus sediminis]